jgi:hypothetical protein
MVTVFPTGPGGAYIPACRLSNGDGTSKYVDMRSWEETREDNAEIFGDQWDMLLGDAVTVRDDIVDKAKTALGFSLGTLAVIGVGVLLAMHYAND